MAFCRQPLRSWTRNPAKGAANGIAHRTCSVACRPFEGRWRYLRLELGVRSRETTRLLEVMFRRDRIRLPTPVVRHGYDEPSFLAEPGSMFEERREVFFIWLAPKVRARCAVNRPVIVGAAAAAIVVAAIVLTFFIDRKPDDPVWKTSSLWEREAPVQALRIRSPDRRGGEPRTAIARGGQEAVAPLQTSAG